MADSAFGPPPLPDKSEPVSVALPAYVPGQSGNGKVGAFNNADGPSFSDVLDVLNPLQHIPVINTIYREVTGDKEGAVAELVGGALWGGAIGAAAAIVNLAVQDGTGKDIGEHVASLFEDDSAASGTAVAQNTDKTTGKDGSGDATAAAVVETPVVAAAESLVPVSDAEAEAGAAAGTTAVSQAATPVALNAADPDGPMQAGDYLVFGASRLAQPSTNQLSADTSPARPATASSRSNRQDSVLPATSPSTAAAATPSPLAAQVAVAEGGPTQQGDYLVFGSAATTLAANDASPPAADLPAAASGKQAGAQEDGANRRAPARSTITPRNNLPPPTTGPAAIPGNHQPPRAVSAGGNNTDWFSAAFNAGMDKYQKAAALTGGSGAATPGPTAITPAAAAGNDGNTPGGT